MSQNEEVRAMSVGEEGNRAGAGAGLYELGPPVGTIRPTGLTERALTTESGADYPPDDSVPMSEKQAEDSLRLSEPPPLPPQHNNDTPSLSKAAVTLLNHPGSATSFMSDDEIELKDELHKRGSFVSATDIRPDMLPEEEGGHSALLNLPPPLPFDLRVDGLTVGVPLTGPNKWVPKWFRKRKKSEADEDAEDGTPKRKKWILKDVGCECKSGEVLAILGGSGSGKTTLLNAIAHRLSGLPVEEGQVGYYAASRRSEHQLLSKADMKRRIGFVRQQDYLVEHLTVRETLTYAARLRLPTSLSAETIAMIVEQTIDELGLRDAADTVVGGPLRKGISGGEKRRLSIGCVLVTLPSVLILDEPTSGLDAFTSYLLLLTLSQLARRGRTVVLSIHAPRSDAFPIFDRIALLSKGEIVYSGHRADCLPWFAGLGHEVQRGVNPLDFLIDVSTVDNRDPDKEDMTRQRVKHLIDSWRSRELSRPMPPRLDKDPPHEANSGIALPDAAAVSGELQLVLNPSADNHAELDAKRPGFFKQTAVLLARAHKNVYRNWPQMAGLLVQSIILGILMGVTFYRLPENPTGIQSLKNLSFQFIPGALYLQQVFWIYKFCTDLVIFDREREDRLYDIVPYVVSDWISFVVPCTLSPALYTIILYFMAGLRTENLAARLFTQVASTVAVQYAIQGGAFVSSSLLRSFAPASMCGNSLNLMQIMSSGFIVVHVPVYLAWVRWISPYFYSYRVVATLQFKDRQFDCPAASTANLDQCVGNNVLRGLQINPNTNVGIWIAACLAVWVVEYALACLILWAGPAGGLKHAAEIDSHHRGKGTDVKSSQMTRDMIDVEVKGLSMSWERRGWSIVKDKRKVILDDLSMKFPAGEVSAILGPSGAGKSTLLQLLAGRQLNPGPSARFRLNGQLLFANQPASAASRSNIAFVEQEDDWHLPSLTVRETLRYAAILRLPGSMPKRQKIARAETVLVMLGLKDCADLPVGGPLLKGISGGEKRRLSLAVQMINDPAVLLVDEPTSGLDASIALSVMQVLKDIAAAGRTVIATIHQPRSDIWRLADNVTLLAKGGVVAYSGKQSSAVPYFTSIGYPMPSEYFNPADHLLDLVSVDPRLASHQASKSRVANVTTLWRSAAHTESGAEIVSDVTVHRGSRSTSIFTALPVVLERSFKSLWRQKEVFFSRIIQPPLFSAIILLFFQRLSHGPAGAQDRIGLTIQTTSPIPFIGLLNAMAIYPAERDLYFHEVTGSAKYGAGTFVTNYTIMEIWAELLASCMFAAILHVGSGMQTSARIFFEFAITIFTQVNMGESMALICGAWIHTEGLTVVVVSTVLSMIGQFSGVISLSVPTWLADIAWGFTTKAAARVQIINEAIGLKFNCTTAEVQSGQCIAQTGEQLLSLFGFRDLETARYTGLVIGIMFAWRVIAWASIALRARRLR